MAGVARRKAQKKKKKTKEKERKKRRKKYISNGNFKKLWGFVTITACNKYE